MPLPDDTMVTPLHSGRRTFDGDESVIYRWALYSRSEVEEFLQVCLVDSGDSEAMAEQASMINGWSATYGGPGQWFSNAPTVKMTRTKVLIIQRAGWDI